MLEKTKQFSSTKSLRQFLIQQMQGVADGTVNGDQTKHITNLAQQVYNTLNIEIKTAVALAKLGDGASIKPVEFGEEADE